MDLHSSLRSRRPRIAALSLGVATVAVLASGCGSDSGAGSVTSRDAPTSSAASTSLTIQVTDGKTTTSTLTCDPDGGDHSGPAAACAVLAKSGSRFLPPPADGLMCTAIYGGDQTAMITGTWRGKPVNARFSRENGCQISRWDALTPLLPRVATTRAQ